ncbi:MAG: hypothetical protein MN733_24055 [Nitrososphaera sp.]|nr:hypothetical protein [Nitrososphaera sp.]
MNQAQSKPGLAYGVFKCSDPRKPEDVRTRITKALENIKLASEETKIPPEIDFFVIELSPILTTLRANGGDAEFIEKIEAVERQGANYILQASLPNNTNHQAAEELGFAFNCLYGGTELFDAENEGRSPLVMEIYFRHDVTGRYVSKMEIDSQ